MVGQLLHLQCSAVLPLRAQANPQRGLALFLLGERVLQRRAGIAHALAPHPLWGVQMAQRHVIEAVKDLRGHRVHAAHHALLGIGQLRRACAQHELVRHQHVARGRIDVHLLHRHPHRICIAANLRRALREGPPHLHRAHEGQQVQVHLAEFVPQHVARGGCAERGRDEDRRARQDALAVGHLLRGIVVAADDEAGLAQLRQARQKGAGQLHRLARGLGLVVEIPGNQQRVDPRRGGHLQDLREDVPLIVHDRLAAELLPDVQIRYVQKIHAFLHRPQDFSGGQATNFYFHFSLRERISCLTGRKNGRTQRPFPNTYFILRAGRPPRSDPRSPRCPVCRCPAPCDSSGRRPTRGR